MRLNSESGTVDLPAFASFPLLATASGRAALSRYFGRFLDLAEETELPFVLDTATWRANPDWGEHLGYTRPQLADVNQDAARFARELAAGRPEVTISGLLGPRGDGYVVGERMSEADAEAYHAWQIGVLAEAGPPARQGHRRGVDGGVPGGMSSGVR